MANENDSFLKKPLHSREFISSLRDFLKSPVDSFKEILNRRRKGGQINEPALDIYRRYLRDDDVFGNLMTGEPILSKESDAKDLGKLLKPEVEKPIVPEKPLPTKPISECGVKELDGLTERQIGELLFQTSKYRERKAIAQNVDTKYIYTIQVNPPNPQDVEKYASKIRISSGGVDEDDIAIGEVEDYPSSRPDHKFLSDYKIITIKIPYLENCYFDTFESKVLPVINKLLSERNVPILLERNIYSQDEHALERYWSDNPNEALDKHDYGDGRLFNEYESLESVLAQEVKDLKELGLDFNDIVNAIEPITSNLHASFLREYYRRYKQAGLIKDNDELKDEEIAQFGPLTFHIDDEADDSFGVPTRYEHICDQDETIRGETLQWKYNVISLPFKVKESVLDHRLNHPSQRGWKIALSETSLSLYENRVVEGFYLPHYRISAARAVWALQIGSPELQAKALEIDWRNTTAALKTAERHGNRVLLESILNYMMQYFPRDESHWREHGFPGYQYDGQSYENLKGMLTDLRERFSKFRLSPRVITGGFNEIN